MASNASTQLSRDQRRRYLNMCPAFHGLDDEQLAPLLDSPALQLRSYQARTVFYQPRSDLPLRSEVKARQSGQREHWGSKRTQQHNQPQALRFLIRGHVVLSPDARQQRGPSAPRASRVLWLGSMFGEQWVEYWAIRNRDHDRLSAPRQSSYSAHAKDDVQVLELPQERFAEVFGSPAGTELLERIRRAYRVNEVAPGAVQILAAQEVFAQVRPEYLYQLLEGAQVVNLAADIKLVTGLARGQPPTGFYVILDGTVAVHSDSNGLGGEAEYADSRTAGQCIGLGEMLRGIPFGFRVRTESPVRLVYVRRKRLDELVSYRPGLLRTLRSAVGNKLDSAFTDRRSGAMGGMDVALVLDRTSAKPQLPLRGLSNLLAEQISGHLGDQVCVLHLVASATAVPSNRSDTEWPVHEFLPVAAIADLAAVVAARLDTLAERDLDLVLVEASGLRGELGFDQLEPALLSLPMLRKVIFLFDNPDSFDSEQRNIELLRAPVNQVPTGVLRSDRPRRVRYTPKAAVKRGLRVVERWLRRLDSGPIWPMGTVRVRFCNELLSALNSRPHTTHLDALALDPAVQRRSEETLQRWARGVTGRRVGLALGGGGALGYTHVPLIRGLNAFGVPIDIVSGSSFGAVVGAYYACLGMRGLDRVVDDWWVWLLASSMAITTSAPIAVAADLGIDLRDLHDLDVPFFPVVTDADIAAEWDVRRGRVSEGVRASGSLPPFLAATVRGDRRFLDGGLVANVPARVLADEGADLIIASNPIPNPPQRRRERPLPVPVLGTALAEFNPWRRLDDTLRATLMLMRAASNNQDAAVEVLYEAETAGRPPFAMYDREAIIKETEHSEALRLAVAQAQSAWHKRMRKRPQRILQTTRGGRPVLTLNGLLMFRQDRDRVQLYPVSQELVDELAAFLDQELKICALTIRAFSAPAVGEQAMAQAARDKSAQGSSQGSSQASGQASGQRSGQGFGQGSTQASGQRSGQGFGQGSSQGSGQGFGQGSDQGSGQGLPEVATDDFQRHGQTLLRNQANAVCARIKHRLRNSKRLVSLDLRVEAAVWQSRAQIPADSLAKSDITRATGIDFLLEYRADKELATLRQEIEFAQRALVDERQRRQEAQRDSRFYALLADASYNCREGDLARGRELALKAAKLRPQEEVVDQVLRSALQRRGRTVQHYDGLGTSVTALAWAPDSRRAAVVGSDHQVRIWDLGAGEPESVYSHFGYVVSVAWSPDGRYLASTGHDRMVRLSRVDAADAADASAVALVATMSTATWNVAAVRFSPGGRYLVGTGSDRAARLWNPVDGSEHGGLLLHQGRVSCAAFAGDEEHVATASDDGAVKVWRCADTELAAGPFATGNAVGSLDWHPDGRRLVAASGNRALIYNTAQPEAQPIVLRGHRWEVNAVAWSPDGTCVATASADGSARIWTADGALVTSLRRDRQPLGGVLWHPQEAAICTFDQGGALAVWEVEGGAPRAILFGHRSAVRVAAWSPDGAYLLSGDGDGSLRLWHPDHLDIPLYEGHDRALSCGAWQPGAGHWVATADRGGAVHAWDPTQPARARVLLETGPETAATPVAPETAKAPSEGAMDGASQARTWVSWRPDGAALAAGNARSSTLWLWNDIGDGSGDGWQRRELDVAPGTIERLWWGPRPVAAPDPAQPTPASAASPAPAGTLASPLIAVAGARHVSVWEAASGRLYSRVPDQQPGDVTWVAWRPGAPVIAVGCFVADEPVRIWALSEGGQEARLAFVLEGHSDGVWQLDWSPDGRQLVTACNDKRVRMFDVPSAIAPGIRGQRLRPRAEGEFLWGVRTVAFGPNGRFIAAGDAEKRLQVWDVTRWKPAVIDAAEHWDAVGQVAWNRDGTTLLSASDDSRVCLWDVARQERRGEIALHTRAVTGASWSPDGRYVLVTSSDETASVHPADTELLVDAVSSQHSDNDDNVSDGNDSANGDNSASDDVEA